MTDTAYSIAQQISSQLSERTPHIAVILGSGLGGLAEEIENRIGDADIYLIGVELSTLFHLPPVKNLSILYR